MTQPDKNLKRKYTLSEYDPEWTQRFLAIKELLSVVFSEQAISIEHVGSTAVPDMTAKPIIDVLITVKAMEPFTHQKELMTDAGYEWGENYIAPNTVFFFKTKADGEKVENIHICGVGSPKTRQFLVMRDYLRTHPEKVKEYSDLKKKNTALYPDNYPAYREAKAPFLEKLEAEAYEWFRNKTENNLLIKNSYNK